MSSEIKFNDVFIFLLVMFSLNFFSATFAHFGFFKNISYTYMLGAILISLPYFFQKSCGFIFPIQLICISVALSIFMAYISWEQDLSYSLSTVPYLIWFVFFYLVKYRYPIDRIENISIIYGFVYIILYFYQFYHNDTVYFGFKEEFVEDRGIIRINFPGAGVFFLAYFVSLNKVLEERSQRWIYLLFLVLGIIVTLLQVTRQSIILILGITFWNFFKNVNWRKKVALFLIFSVITILFYNSENPVSRGLNETQKETISDGEQYIRILSGTYFIKDFSPNISSRILGNGLPNNTSNYGKFTIYLAEAFGYYISDVGLIGVYAMFGIFPILGYIVIFIKSLYFRTPKCSYYLKYYMVFLLLTSLTSDNVFSINFMITNVFVIYGYHFLLTKEYYNA